MLTYSLNFELNFGRFFQLSTYLPTIVSQCVSEYETNRLSSLVYDYYKAYLHYLNQFVVVQFSVFN